MKTVTIQGIEIPLREVSCVCDNKTSPRGDFVNISVNLTNQCQYECAFCCNPVRTGNDFNFRLFARFITDTFEHLPVVIFNPRRAVYPKDDKRAMIEQITWEHRYLADSDIFSMYFAPGDSVQPICMFEYGTYLTKAFFTCDWQRFVVCADTKYSRFDDVVIQTSLVNPDIFVCGHLDDHIRRIETAIFAELKRKSLISF